jgi:hypothetical protein
MPRRLPLQAAKATTLAAAALPVAAATAAVSALAAGDAARIPAATAYLTLTTLLAAAVAGLVRHPVPAVLLLLSLYFIVDPLLRARFDALAGYLPDTAALDPSRGAAATIMWTLFSLALAVLVFHRRDA